MTDVITPTRRSTAPSRSVLYGVLVLVVLSLVGAAVSVASDLSPDLWDALGPTGRLSIPWPMMLAQVVMAVLAGSTRRPLALLGSGFVTLALLAGAVSGFFDGGYAEDRFTTFERIYQLGFVVAIVVVGVIAATRFVRVLRPAKA